jgi:hypothetical protein
VKEFKWGHLVLTLGLDEQQRLALLNQAEEQDWDVWELQREIQRRKGMCRGGGHPRKQPKSFGLLPDIIQLLRLSERWNERYEKACARMLIAGATRLDKHIMVPPLRKQLTRCLNELNRLLGNTADAEKLTKELLAKLPAEAAVPTASNPRA